MTPARFRVADADTTVSVRGDKVRSEAPETGCEETQAARTPVGLVLLSALAAALFLYFDLSLPLGVAGGVPYVALVLIALWFPSPWAVLALAGIGSMLTVAGYFWSEPAGAPWMVLVNRALALFAIWIVAVLGIQRRLGEIALARSHHQLVDRVTELRRAEETLHESEERFRAVFENSPAAIFVKDAEGRLRMANKRFEELYGFAEAEVLGKMSHDLFPKRYADAYVAQDRESLDSLKVVEREQDIIFADGSVHTIIATKFPIFGPEGRAANIGTIVIDITERKELEAQLRQAQKLEALGQLTGGIAHEFNNLLQAIVGSLDVIKHEVQDSGRAKRMIELAQRSALRGKDLTGRLLSYVGTQPIAPEVIDVGEFVRNAVELFEPMLGETIRIETQVADDLWPIKADREQLEAALLNLALNSRDAMADGGRLTIEAANVHIDEVLAAKHPHSVTPGDYGKLAVADIGTGMSAEVKEQVFDPFFTTKDVGKGTGLGLSMVYGFIERQSGGFIDIDSEEGRGTTVALYLPRAEAKKAEAPQPAEGSKEPSAGAGTILVVEDDAAVLDSMALLLESMGYTVFRARDGAEALSQVEQADAVDLLLTDVILPGGLRGPQLVEEIRGKSPTTKAILMSGHPESELGVEGLLERGVRLLKKPFQQDELESAISEALGSGGKGGA